MTDHVRDRFDLVPDAAAEAVFLDALDRGRLHHAWLICGPEGSGKATFAYRAARRLLGARPDPSRGPLGAAPDDPVSKLISAQSHPDLLVMERAVDGGKLKKSISVDQARDLPDFFSRSSSQAGRRVAIIDAADDLNMNAANALLKALEEPPEGAVLLLVSHSPGRLLGTIRSRCRRLRFAPWPVEALSELLQQRLGVSPDQALAAAQMAGGSPGVALALADGSTSDWDRLARAWVAGEVDPAEQLATADTFRGAEGQARFEAVMDRLAAAVRQAAIDAGPGRGEGWAALWSRLVEAPDRAAALNLDRGDILAGALSDLARTRAGAC